MYGRTLNEDFAPLVPGTKAYNQAKRAREEMLEGFVFIQRGQQQKLLAGNVKRRKQA